jgi:preprotein translocase subunit SecD
MAKKAPRPGRTLIIFGLVVVAMYVGLAINGVWKPKLGLDLQGGTRITLSASTTTGEAVTKDKLDEAAGIIDSRVNAYGVAESEVSTQGSDTIIVEIPGANEKNIVDSVKQTAQLRFRLVALTGAGTAAQQPTPSPSPSASAGGGTTDKAGKGDKTKSGKAQPSASASPAGRALSSGLLMADKAGKNNGKQDNGGASASDQPTALPSTPPTAPGNVSVPTDKSSVQDMLKWTRSPDQVNSAKFSAFSCNDADKQVDDPSKPLLACDSKGQKYLLSPAIIQGTQLDNASFGIPPNQVNYVVNLNFNGDATKVFADVTRAIVGTNEQFAIVLDGKVLSAPVVNSPITDGNAEISGSFTANSAKSLSNSLKYGALPLKFEAPVVTEEGPTLASDQLSAGLLAGAIGLALVMVYCLLYYRGLGLVILASLLVAAAVTYAAILFLSQNAGFTLTLPGIAGLIVAVGITADSFIVYFERIRDEMREGKSLRVAVEAGWARARNTCVAADAVSLLAAVVLFIFAIGVVKGFAFALGISTVIDLIVFFWFTKPLVSCLARFRFFASGHKWSGLSPDHIGIERIGSARPLGARPAGGVAR